jgi:hypothetical protein
MIEIRKREPPPTHPVIDAEAVVEHIRQQVETSPVCFANNLDRILGTLVSAPSVPDRCSTGKIRAIQLLRMLFPMGLKEAKDYIESEYIHA